MCCKLACGRLFRLERQTSSQINYAKIHSHHQIIVILSSAVDIRIIVVGIASSLNRHLEGFHQHLHPFDPAYDIGVYRC